MMPADDLQQSQSSSVAVDEREAFSRTATRFGRVVVTARSRRAT
jgi:hypothetical protein